MHPGCCDGDPKPFSSPWCRDLTPSPCPPRAGCAALRSLCGTGRVSPSPPRVLLPGSPRDAAPQPVTGSRGEGAHGDRASALSPCFCLPCTCLKNPFLVLHVVGHFHFYPSLRLPGCVSARPEGSSHPWWVFGRVSRASVLLFCSRAHPKGHCQAREVSCPCLPPFPL